jgi:hypothetical protein
MSDAFFPRINNFGNGQGLDSEGIDGFKKRFDTEVKHRLNLEHEVFRLRQTVKKLVARQRENRHMQQQLAHDQLQLRASGSASHAQIPSSPVGPSRGHQPHTARINRVRLQQPTPHPPSYGSPSASSSSISALSALSALSATPGSKSARKHKGAVLDGDGLDIASSTLLERIRGLEDNQRTCMEMLERLERTNNSSTHKGGGGSTSQSLSFSAGELTAEEKTASTSASDDGVAKEKEQHDGRYALEMEEMRAAIAAMSGELSALKEHMAASASAAAAASVAAAAAAAAAALPNATPS